jgi:hypothetical protein
MGGIPLYDFRNGGALAPPDFTTSEAKHRVAKSEDVDLRSIIAARQARR